jgi:hypothetical protein
VRRLPGSVARDGGSVAVRAGIAQPSMDDDIGSHQPYQSHHGFNVYLVDGREHCLKFTKDLEHATGLVLAEVIDDE